MPINSEKNKRFILTISKKDYERLERQAKLSVRSASKQALYYILTGLKQDENEVQNKEIWTSKKQIKLIY